MPNWPLGAPCESRAQYAPAVDLFADDDLSFDAPDSLLDWYDETENAEAESQHGPVWQCLHCGNDRFIWNPGHGKSSVGCWSCAACFSDEYFDTAVPQRHQTERGTWVFMPNGHNAGSPTDSMARRPSQKQRRRRRRRHAGPPPDDDPSEAPEGGEEEVRTSDPSVDVTPAGSVVRRPHAPAVGQQPAQPANPVEALTTALQQFVDAANTSRRRQGEHSSSTDSWVSAMGPQRGVKFRGGAPPAPPTWAYNSSDLRAYEKFERKVKVWELHVKHFMTDAEAALTLFIYITEG